MAKTQSQTNRNNRERGKAFERRMAKLLGMVRVPYSGSSEVFGEGDIRDSEDQKQSFYMGECKSMTPKSKTEINYIIKRDWLTTLVRRAKKAGNMFPFLPFVKAGDPQAYVIVTAEDFKLLRQALDIHRHETISMGDSLDSLRFDINARWCDIYGESEDKDNADESGDFEG